MPYRRTPVAIYLGYLGLLVFVAMAGCNRGNNGTPSTAAAIDGSAKESPSKRFKRRTLAPAIHLRPAPPGGRH